MTSIAAHPYLRYAATEVLHAALSRRSVSGWTFLASAAAARRRWAECPDDLHEYTNRAPRAGLL